MRAGATFRGLSNRFSIRRLPHTRLERVGQNAKKAARASALATFECAKTGYRTGPSKSFDDIVNHCCYAWETLIDQP